MKKLFLLLVTWFGYTVSMYGMERQISLIDFFASSTDIYQKTSSGGMLAQFGNLIPTDVRNDIAQYCAGQKKMWYEKQRFLHDNWVSSVFFNDNKNRLITIVDERIGYEWDISRGCQVGCFNYIDQINPACLNQDGTEFIEASGFFVIKCDFVTEQELGSFKHNDWINSAYFSSDKTKIVISSDDGKAYILRAETGEKIQSFDHDSRVFSACWNLDETFLITTLLDKSACIWNIKSGQLLHTFWHDKPVSAACFNQDETQFATASSDRTARIWQQYNNFSLNQVLLCKLLFTWLRVEKPDKRAKSIQFLLGKICCKTDLDEIELNVVWNTFPPQLQEFMWHEMRRLICKYGK